MVNFDKLASVMKLGTKNALICGERVTLDCAPFKRGEEIMIPLSAVPAVATAKKKVIENGYEYAPLSEISGIYRKTDGMGLIILDSDPAVLEISRENHLRDMLLLMGKFIFDIEKVPMTRSYAPATEEERAGFYRVGEFALGKLTERNHSHPFIYADSEVFASLRRAYETKADETLCSYIDRLVKSGEKHYSSAEYKLNENGDGLAKHIVNSFEDPDGYDVGGRQGASASVASNMLYIAFACKMTGDLSYARTAYYMSADLGKWEHWGPGHFLNCADCTEPMSVTYDWLYNEWKELGLDTEVIREAIYLKGVHNGYESLIEDRCDYPSKRQGTGWRFKLKPDNWNSVCNSGMIHGCLALLADGVGGSMTEERYRRTVTLLGGSLSSVMQDGLVINQYVPDGSYVESNSYWSYGTNSLFKMIGALHSALGTDLGLHNSFGLDKTCYYALNVESADFVGWNYHDGSLSAQSTAMFNLFGHVSGDHALYAFRADHLRRGKGVTLSEVLYYPSIRGEQIPSLEGMEYDYFMEGIDGFTVRNGWESGSLFAGIMGGYNPGGGSHNHIDSGAFVYHNAGKLWFTDLGSDSYLIERYFGNCALYRRNAEGHNVINLLSLPYGQSVNATGRIVKTASCESGAYAVLDNKDVYKDAAVRNAMRALILTNDRKTVVIRDEMELEKPDTAYWLGHFYSSKIEATVSADGRECRMRQGDEELSVRLITDNKDARFEILNCTDFILSGSADFEKEYSREELSRLAVRFGEVSSFTCDVVISLSRDAEEYSYTPVPISELL